MTVPSSHAQKREKISRINTRIYGSSSSRSSNINNQTAWQQTICVTLNLSLLCALLKLEMIECLHAPSLLLKIAHLCACKVDLDTQLNEMHSTEKKIGKEKRMSKSETKRMAKRQKEQRKREKQFYMRIWYVWHAHTSHLTFCTWTAALMFKLVFSTLKTTQSDSISNIDRKKSRPNEKIWLYSMNPRTYIAAIARTLLKWINNKSTFSNMISFYINKVAWFSIGYF